MEFLPIDTTEERLIIYEAVLAKADLSANTNSGLCVDLRDYSGRNHTDWYYYAARIHFPKFGKYYGREIAFERLYLNDIEAWRREVLQKCIDDCKKS